MDNLDEYINKLKNLKIRRNKIQNELDNYNRRKCYKK